MSYVHRVLNESIEITIEKYVTANEGPRFVNECGSRLEGKNIEHKSTIFERSCRHVIISNIVWVRRCWSRCRDTSIMMQVHHPAWFGDTWAATASNRRRHAPVHANATYNFCARTMFKMYVVHLVLKYFHFSSRKCCINN